MTEEIIAAYGRHMESVADALAHVREITPREAPRDADHYCRIARRLWRRHDGGGCDGRCDGRCDDIVWDLARAARAVGVPVGSWAHPDGRAAELMLYWHRAAPRPERPGSPYNPAPDATARAWRLGLAPDDLRWPVVGHLLPARAYWPGHRRRVLAALRVGRAWMRTLEPEGWRICAQIRTADLRRIAHLSPWAIRAAAGAGLFRTPRVDWAAVAALLRRLEDPDRRQGLKKARIPAGEWGGFPEADLEALADLSTIPCDTIRGALHADASLPDLARDLTHAWDAGDDLCRLNIEVRLREDYTDIRDWFAVGVRPRTLAPMLTRAEANEWARQDCSADPAIWWLRRHEIQGWTRDAAVIAWLRRVLASPARREALFRERQQVQGGRHVLRGRLVDHVDQLKPEDLVAGVVDTFERAALRVWQSSEDGMAEDSTIICRRPAWWRDDPCVVLLDTPATLVAEGRAMRHCIATHAAWVRAGDEVVASIRAQDGSRSTVAMDPITAHVREHRGPDNKNPSSSCEEVLRNFLQRCRGVAAGNRTEEKTL